MRQQCFEFAVCRLIVDRGEPYLFKKAINTDEDIVNIIKEAVNAKYDIRKGSKSRMYLWGIRDFQDYSKDINNQNSFYKIRLAQSTKAQIGLTLTDNGIVPGESKLTPPLADRIISIFFIMERHLVIVEYNSIIMHHKIWLRSLKNIFKSAAKNLGFSDSIILEPIPQENKIISTLESFNILTRIKLVLRKPNPEFSIYSERIRKEMENSRIEELTQDMRNPKGLNMEKEALPYSVASLAQYGYKKGEVTMEGIKAGKFMKIKSGQGVAKGRISMLIDITKKNIIDFYRLILDELSQMLPPNNGEK